MSRIVPIALAVAVLAGCAQTAVEDAGGGTFVIKSDVPSAMLLGSNLEIADNFNAARVDETCPNGFVRVSERRYVEGDRTGRALTIRCNP
jgi:hypothetical protein